MKKTYQYCLGIAAAGVIALLAGQAELGAQQGDPAIQVGATDIGGVVAGAKGPEAGVWVIAETTDLPTKFAKIVVTDDRGRYLIPELPKGNYQIWVRGYGLVDSPKVTAAPGKMLDLKAVPAPSAAAAAEYYPPIYWHSLLKIPAASEFPGTGAKGNGIEPVIATQGHWLNITKTNGCMSCHALGNKGTRTMPKDFAHMNSTEAWARRIASGQAMTNMINAASRVGTRAFTEWADWTDRIAKGELPFDQPARPQGVERNVVLTTWEWSTPTHYMHDIISTDRRKPTVNANGKLYGSTEESTDMFPALDPRTHTPSTVKHPVLDPKTPSSKQNTMAPSPYWGDQPIWESQTSIHNQMMDEKGRVWAAARVRPAANPDWCRKGGDHPSAKVFPMENAVRHASVYDPATGRFDLISTCFPTHHVILAEDANNTVWFSSGGIAANTFGWLNRKLFDETGDGKLAQGWAPFVIDTNGNGRRDEWVEPNQAVDPQKDKRITAGLYSVAFNPKDGSIWGTAIATFPSFLVRVAPGADPTNTALTEIYAPPMPGYGARGGDIDRNGVFWVSLSSGHLGRFDRSKCKGPLNGPAAATGQHCPEGWTLYRFPGPQFRDVKEDGSAEASYFVWVDQFNIFGLGENVPIATGNQSDAYFALVNGKFVTIRVPYRGFFSKWAEGRIDDPKAGWKGRSLWATDATRAVFHSEGGTANKPRVIRFQMRPDPLAK
jgi:hypothetical protein